MAGVGGGPTPARMVESRCGAVALGRTYLSPPLSSGGALVVQPWLRFHIPLIGRVEDWRAGLGRSLGYWDRSRARPAVGGGFPFLLFRLQDGFTVPPWLTFPEAPL